MTMFYGDILLPRQSAVGPPDDVLKLTFGYINCDITDMYMYTQHHTQHSFFL